jgi:molybdopterin-guanine dinucleotide biosynthesis protein
MGGNEKQKGIKMGKICGKGRRKIERKKEEKDTWRGMKAGGKILKTRNKHGRI